MNRVVTIILLCISAMLRVSHSVVYKSSQKIEDMVLKEEQILNRLYTAISETGNDTVLDYFSQFYRERLLKIEQRDKDSVVKYLKHPNGIYSVIKSFSADYQNLRLVLEWSGSPQVQTLMTHLADQTDLVGSWMSFIRLQDVYNFTVSNMIKGDYFGVQGPPLTERDAWHIGHAAFVEGRLEPAIAWLQEVVNMARLQLQTSTGFLLGQETPAQIKNMFALIGRAYLRIGHLQQAEELYRQSLSAADCQDGDTNQLEQELTSPPPPPLEKNKAKETMKRLCSLQEKLDGEKFDPRLKCSYRPARPPYYLFKQELVSVSPYVVLFYDVVTQTEIDHILKLTTARLYTGHVEVNGSSVATGHIRTSDLSFVEDHESPVFADMSRKVAAATGLDSTPFQNGRSFSAEPFQVVNYGMGGHYNIHADTYDQFSKESKKEVDCFKYGGDRLATFLVYLSNVEHGGSTVFPEINLAVKPIKKMALFWYSYKPSGQMDKRTLHAACPVVVGHKWVTNKWIWLYGNTFTRRCGLRKTTNQLAIEKFMRTGWV